MFNTEMLKNIEKQRVKMFHYPTTWRPSLLLTFWQMFSKFFQYAYNFIQKYAYTAYIILKSAKQFLMNIFTSVNIFLQKLFIGHKIFPLVSVLYTF